MKKILLISLLLLTGCAKLSYLVEQGLGQLKLQWRGKKISKVLKDPKISNEIKNKIKDIQTYKKYFYDYFQREESDIYSKVTFLEGKAVTHLVIVSYFDKVEPLKTSFPFYGSFPYLGFFKEKSALKYQEKMKNKDFHTYKRPVSAYSTLGSLEDRILSSFFSFNKYDLAELIFHELFHTIFFVKSNVDLNENLANYFGKEMMYEYFADDKDFLDKRSKKEEKNKEIRQFLVKQINDYKKFLSERIPKDLEDSYNNLNQFLSEEFRPKAEKKCKKLEIESRNCFLLKQKWNNASFAAFMTYEEKGEFIGKLRVKNQFNIKEFLVFLEKKYNQYKKLDLEGSFTTYLEKL